MSQFKPVLRGFSMHATKTFIAILFVISTTTLSANTLTTTTSVPTFTGENFSRTPVVGLSKFDSSLGTLNGVQFRIQNSFSAQAQLHDVGILDITQPHQLGARISFQVSLSDDRGRLFASFLENSMGVSCQGQGSVICSDTLIGATSNVYHAQDDITARLINSTSLQDYLGTGEVQVVELGLFHFNQPGFSQLNFQTAQNIAISELNASINFSMGPATVAIDYFYSPVPMPPSIWLTIVGLLAIGIRNHTGKARRAKPAGSPEPL